MSEPLYDINVTAGDGKYTVRKTVSGGLHALRYGEPWRDLCGDKLVYQLAAELQEARQWAESDQPLPEDVQISACHPGSCEKPDHDLYREALRLVGARRSKAALVALVNWLLVKNKRANEPREGRD